jgi:hypothetical protein
MLMLHLNKKYLRCLVQSHQLHWMSLSQEDGQEVCCA